MRGDSFSYYYAPPTVSPLQAGTGKLSKDVLIPSNTKEKPHLKNQLHRQQSLGRKSLTCFAKMLCVKCITEMVVGGPGGCKGQQCWSWSPCTLVRYNLPGQVNFPPLQQDHLQTLAGNQLLHGLPRGAAVGIGEVARVVWCPHSPFLGTAALESCTADRLFLCQQLHPAQGRAALHGNAPANTVQKLS